MRILDEKGNELTDPDLNMGHLEPDVLTRIIPAIPESAEVSHMEVIWENPDDQNNKLVKKVVTKPYVPPVPEKEIKEHILRYIHYTPEELAAIAAQKEAEEQARIEAEAEAIRRAELQAKIEALPEQVNDLTEAVAEAGSVIGENDELIAALQSDVSDLMEAVAEIGTLVAGE